METKKEFFLRKADAYKMLAEARTESLILIERLNMMITDLVMCENDDQLKQLADRYGEGFLNGGFKHISL